MSNFKKAIIQSSHYGGAHFLALLSGFISFPILTRMLTVKEYGVFSLIITTISIMVALSKLGLQHSIIRFFSEFRSQEKSYTFYSTFFLGSISACLIISFVYAFSIKFILKNLFSPEIKNLLFFITPLIFFSTGLTLFMNFLRAEQRTIFFNSLQITKKYISLFLSLLLMYLFTNHLYGFFLGATFVEGFYFFAFVLFLLSIQKIKFDYFSFNFFKKSLFFSLPLFVMEFLFRILKMGDRYLVQFLLGSEPLGIYSAAYNLSLYVADTFKNPISFAIFPIYMDIWVNKGEEATKDFLSTCFKYFLLVATPMTMGFITLRKDIILLLNSSNGKSVTFKLMYVDKKNYDRIMKEKKECIYYLKQVWEGQFLL